MKFNFLRLPSEPSPAFPQRHSVLYPIIPIRIINPNDPNKLIDIRAMIDSGADVSIFPGSLGRVIGLNIENDKIEIIKGIGGQEIITYLHEIIFEIGGWKYPSITCFSSDEITFPVLGRNGFFDLFEIKFDFRKEIIELKPKVDPIQS